MFRSPTPERASRAPLLLILLAAAATVAEFLGPVIGLSAGFVALHIAAGIEVQPVHGALAVGVLASLAWALF